jgi:pteridine reductase
VSPPSLPAPPLADQTVLVTGAARRIGRVIAHRLHSDGARLAIHARHSVDEAAQLVDELNARRRGSAICVTADLCQPAGAEALVSEVLDRFGRLDGLVNNASSFFPTPLGSIDLAAWNDLVGSNFMAPLFLSQAAAPALREAKGAIVNLTDIHAERPLKGYPLYCAAKGALLTLTRALAVELAPEVRVNAVAPGPILWPENDRFDGEARQAIIDHTLLGREGAPEEIAAAVHFLLANASYVTGQVINVDGGRTAHL